MAADPSDDDSYMHRFALSLLRKHDDGGRRRDTLMPAVMAARHVVAWHFGDEPTDTQMAAFGRDFPQWSVIDGVCSGTIQTRWNEKGEAFVKDGDQETALVPLCRQFLEAYRSRHLVLADGRKNAEAPLPDALRSIPKRASGAKRG